MGVDVTVRERPDVIASLPTTADPDLWTADEKALLDAAGLIARKKNKAPEPAPRSTVVAFLAHCHRTGLDPIAKQIYAIERGGKWTIQVSIDGLRLVAERSGKYAGQTPTEWTADGKTWLEVWPDDKNPPLAARVGILRSDFAQPLYAVARFEAYAVYEDEYEGDWGNRQKTGKKVLSEMWRRRHAEQLAKCVEALGLRKAFPMELSGLYTAEEMDQANPPAEEPRKPAAKPGLEAGTRSAQRDPLPGTEGSEAADSGGLVVEDPDLLETAESPSGSALTRDEGVVAAAAAAVFDSPMADEEVGR